MVLERVRKLEVVRSGFPYLEVECVCFDDIVGILVIKVNSEYESTQILLLKGVEYSVFQIVQQPISFIGIPACHRHDFETVDIPFLLQVQGGETSRRVL